MCVGVLVLVPDPWGSEVARVRASVSGGVEPDIPTHVTLVPPTMVAEDDLPAILEHVGEVAGRHRPYELHLRGTGDFRPVTDVVYLAVTTGGAQCDALQSDLRTGPLATELRYPYHPHVTLAHDVPAAGLDTALSVMASTDAHVDVDGFVLFVDRGDGEWEAVSTFALGGSAPAGD